MQRELLLIISIVSIIIVLSLLRYAHEKKRIKKFRPYDLVFMGISIPFAIFSIFSILSASIPFYFTQQKFRPYDLVFMGISIPFAIFSIFSILSASIPFYFTQQKFIVYISLLIFTTTVLSLVTFSKIQKNNYILNPISFILLSIIPAIINISNIHIVIPVSLLVVIMTFLSYAEDHNNHITMLIVFSTISLLFYILSFISTRAMLLFATISLSIFLIFITEFAKFLNTKKEVHLQANKKSESKIIPFLKHIVFIIIITNFIFIGTVSVHELGHAISAQFSECEETKIVYELTGLPQTEVICEDTSQYRNWILLGILLPIAIALLLMFSGGTSIKEISLEIIGFSMIISYTDFQYLGASTLFSRIVLVIGIAFSLAGLILLVKSRSEF